MSVIIDETSSAFPTWSYVVCMLPSDITSLMLWVKFPNETV